MTRSEWRLLSPLATGLRARFPHEWESLRYQTHFGPEFASWPYYPAAVDFEGVAREAVYSLSRDDRAQLVEQWHSRTRDITVTPAEAILDRYGLVVLEILINRARAAGVRTSF